MAADGGAQGKAVRGIGVTRMQGFVGSFSAVDALGKGVTLHDPAILKVGPAMQGVDAIGLGRGEADVCGNSGTRSKHSRGKKKQKQSHAHHSLISKRRSISQR
jgi:hypothetical protein